MANLKTWLFVGALVVTGVLALLWREPPTTLDFAQEPARETPAERGLAEEVDAPPVPEVPATRVIDSEPSTSDVGRNASGDEGTVIARAVAESLGPVVSDCASYLGSRDHTAVEISFVPYAGDSDGLFSLQNAVVSTRADSSEYDPEVDDFEDCILDTIERLDVPIEELVGREVQSGELVLSLAIPQA